MSEKLQKVLARAGKGSRREMEKVIEAGRVSINGKIATLGERCEPSDVIKLDGHTVKTAEDNQQICRVLMYHKPEGEICSRKDPEGRSTVFDRLPRIPEGRWVAVGRLDINTSGLLLFTNDGELANRLMHPSHEVEREYSVRVFGEVPDNAVSNLRRGVQLEDGMAKFDKITPAAGEGINKWFNVVLKEGRNREVRRLWESQEVQVSRLIRIRYGEIRLDKRLPNGAWEELDLEHVNYLRQMVQLPKEKESLLTIKHEDINHHQLQRIRRAIKKHKIRRHQRSSHKPKK